MLFDFPESQFYSANLRNDCWTVGAAAGYLIDDKTDVYFDHSLYRATNYFKISRGAVPCGIDAAAVTISRPLAQRIGFRSRGFHAGCGSWRNASVYRFVAAFVCRL